MNIEDLTIKQARELAAMFGPTVGTSSPRRVRLPKPSELLSECRERSGASERA